MENLNAVEYTEGMKAELKRRALVMERILLLISPIAVLGLLNGVFLLRAFFEWVFLKKDFYSNPNLVWLDYTKYIILALILVVLVYSAYESRKEHLYGKL